MAAPAVGSKESIWFTLIAEECLGAPMRHSLREKTHHFVELQVVSAENISQPST